MPDADGGIVSRLAKPLVDYFTQAADPVKAAASRAEFCATTDAKLNAGTPISNTDAKKFDLQCNGAKPN